MAEEAAGAEAAEWAEAMVLILEANGNSIDTAAAIDRKYFSSVSQKRWFQRGAYVRLEMFSWCLCGNPDESNCFSSLKGEEKRGGGGSHNWGTVKDELK